MATRDKEREKVKHVQQEEAAKRNAEAKVKAEARITATLKTNVELLTKRREIFNTKEKEADDRRK